ncbi:hypothetical protein [Streptomyces sp. NPDC088719]
MTARLPATRALTARLPATRALTAPALTAPDLPVRLPAARAR